MSEQPQVTMAALCACGHAVRMHEVDEDVEGGRGACSSRACGCSEADGRQVEVRVEPRVVLVPDVEPEDEDEFGEAAEVVDVWTPAPVAADGEIGAQEPTQPHDARFWCEPCGEPFRNGQALGSHRRYKHNQPGIGALGGDLTGPAVLGGDLTGPAVRADRVKSPTRRATPVQAAVPVEEPLELPAADAPRLVEETVEEPPVLPGANHLQPAPRIGSSLFRFRFRCRAELADSTGSFEVDAALASPMEFVALVERMCAALEGQG